MPEFLQQSLFEVISELNLNREFCRPIELKLSGPSCRLDKETFDLLSRVYKHRQYSLGIVTGFLNVKDVVAPEDLRRASRAVQKIRQSLGKHTISTSLFTDEMEALKKAVEASGLKAPAVLEAAAFLYFRAIDKEGHRPSSTKAAADRISSLRQV